MQHALTDPYLDEIVVVLKSYDPERIILFGSRARGEADEYSDYDIIVIKRTDRPFLDRLRDMVPYLRQITRPAEILVYTPEEFTHMAETGLGWLVRQEGVTLYERPRLEARRWFQEAQADLTVVRTLRGAGHHATACFHSQQAAEKALKALLYAQGARVVLGYSVRELARQCEGHDPAFAEVADDTALLDQFYITTRYPNGLPAPAIPSQSFTNAQAQSAQEAAERVIRLVEIFLRTRLNVLE